MSEKMRLCPSPELCGVKRHRPGTVCLSDVRGKGSVSSKSGMASITPDHFNDEEEEAVAFENETFADMANTLYPDTENPAAKLEEYLSSQTADDAYSVFEDADQNRLRPYTSIPDADDLAKRMELSMAMSYKRMHSDGGYIGDLDYFYESNPEIAEAIQGAGEYYKRNVYPQTNVGKFRSKVDGMAGDGEKWNQVLRDRGLGTESREGGYGGNHWNGSKSGLYGKELKSAIADDFRAMRDAGALAKDVKITLSMRPHYGNTYSVTEPPGFASLPDGERRLARKELEGRIRNVHNAYSYYASDPQIDNFNAGPSANFRWKDSEKNEIRDW